MLSFGNVVDEFKLILNSTLETITYLINYRQGCKFAVLGAWSWIDGIVGPPWEGVWGIRLGPEIRLS